MNILNIDHTKNKKEKTKPFVCRLCGGTEYESIANITPFTSFGVTMYPDYYQCKQCSVLFKNVGLFSVGEIK